MSPVLKKLMTMVKLFKGIDLDRVHVIEIKGGQHNHLHRVHVDDLDVVVRISMDPKKRKNYYNEELTNQRIASKAGLAPQFLHFNVTTGAMVYRFQVGDKLKSKMLVDNQGLSKKTVGLIRKVHDLDTPFAYQHNALKSLKKRIKANLWKREGLEQKRIERIFPFIMYTIELLEKSPVPDRPIHADLIPDNFIVKKNGPILIDWQISGMGDPHEDLATFLWGADIPINRIKKYLSYYFKKSDPISESRTVLHLLLVIFYWVLRYEKQLIIGRSKAKNEGKQTKRLDEAMELLDSPLFWHAQDVIEKHVKDITRRQKK